MAWDRALTALTLLAVDPVGLGGLVLRARSGPIRDALMSHLSILDAPHARLHPSMEDDALFGGIDLTQTLSTGQIAERAGLLTGEGTAALAMAERSSPAFAARLAGAMDAGNLLTLVCLDEGVDDDEQLPDTLGDRLAFHIALKGPRSEIGEGPDTGAIAAARARLAQVAVSGDVVITLASLCAQLGIGSQRAPLLALRTARAHAAASGRAEVTEADVQVAAALVLSSRATQVPQTESESREQPPEPDSSPETGKDIGTLEDRVLDAVLANLPDNLLSRLRKDKAGGRGAGSGAVQKGNRKGRPKAARAGRFSSSTRLDVIATLRAAAPWQKIRRGSLGNIRVYSSDFRIKQYEERSDRLLIFVVDASGSAAIARLAEAKGAVELLLSEAYARRDYVSLISFRGGIAETLLPPTRSLVQTKRRLAAMPGGGGTPLATAMLEAHQAAERARRQGMTPTIVLLTDGRANIALDGTADRTQAATDALTVAKEIRRASVETITMDLGRRPSSFLSDMAIQMDGHYLPLPRADAAKVSDAVTTAIGV